MLDKNKRRIRSVSLLGLMVLICGLSLHASAPIAPNSPAVMLKGLSVEATAIPSVAPSPTASPESLNGLPIITKAPTAAPTQAETPEPTIPPIPLPTANPDAAPPLTTIQLTTMEPLQATATLPMSTQPSLQTPQATAVAATAPPATAPPTTALPLHSIQTAQLLAATATPPIATQTQAAAATPLATTLVPSTKANTAAVAAFAHIEPEPQTTAEAFSFSDTETVAPPTPTAEMVFVTPPPTPRPGPTPTIEHENSEGVRFEIIRREDIPGTIYYTIELWLTDIKQMRSAFSADEFNSMTETVGDIADRNNALLAINGDFATFNDGGIIIRNGELFRDNRSTRELLLIDKHGDFMLYKDPPENSEEMALEFMEKEIWHTFVFGPVLVDKGEEIELPKSFFINTKGAMEPRTAIGQLGPLHYLWIVVDGRQDDHSRGVSLPRLQDLFMEYNALYAFNLDGGGSTTLYYDGEVINKPANGGQRRVPDIIYIEK